MSKGLASGALNMIEVKTAELDGPALHWVVAQIEGVPVDLAPPHYGTGWRVFQVATGCAYRPTVDWGQCGPLLERFFVTFGAVCTPEQPRTAGQVRIRAHGHKLEADGLPKFSRLGAGPNIRVAACRSIVLAHRGDSVLVPEVLAQVGWGAGNASGPV